MNRGIPLRSFALAIATLFLLTSCTDDPQPIEPTATATPEPTGNPPTLPDSAKADTPAGAANFVKYWIETSNYAALSGDTAELRDLSDPSCTGCDKYIELYESIYESGGYIKGANRSIGEVDLEIADRDVIVRGDVRAEEGRYRESRDGPEQISKANETSVEFALAFEKRAWHMKQIGLPE